MAENIGVAAGGSVAATAYKLFSYSAARHGVCMAASAQQWRGDASAAAAATMAAWRHICMKNNSAWRSISWRHGGIISIS